MIAAANIVFVGGPGSGKSNYLFRTWIAIERNKSRLIANGLPGDVDYLHAGASILLEGRFAPHTSKDTRTVCEIPVAQRDRADSASTLLVPDATGELWLDLYRRREWPEQWDALVTKTCGFILFVCVGSSHNVAALDWLTCERFYGSGISPQPTDVPTQVLLVEWLQILRSIAHRKIGHSYHPRLSVVLTAWDRVPADRQQENPQNYLETEFPLFAQFLRADAHGFVARVFGLSIVGGDLERDPDFYKASLLSGETFAVKAQAIYFERDTCVLEQERFEIEKRQKRSWQVLAGATTMPDERRAYSLFPTDRVPSSPRVPEVRRPLCG